MKKYIVLLFCVIQCSIVSAQYSYTDSVKMEMVETFAVSFFLEEGQDVLQKTINNSGIVAYTRSIISDTTFTDDEIMIMVFSTGKTMPDRCRQFMAEIEFYTYDLTHDQKLASFIDDFCTLLATRVWTAAHDKLFETPREFHPFVKEDLFNDFIRELGHSDFHIIAPSYFENYFVKKNKYQNIKGKNYETKK